MSTPTRKISEIATQADALTATDRVEITQAMSTTPVTRYATPGQITDFVETDISTLPNGLVTNAMVNASAGIVDTKLATISTAGKVSNSATTATNNNTASAIVARDANGDFAARDASLRQVILRGDTSGTATIKTPAAAGTPTFTLPAGTGSSGQFLQTNGSGVLSWAAAGGGPQYAVYHTTATSLSVPATGQAAIPFDTEQYDPDSIGSVANDTITLAAGTYLINGHVPVLGVINNATWNVFWYNATTSAVVSTHAQGFNRPLFVSDTFGSASAHAVITLSATTDIQLRIANPEGNARSLFGGSSYNGSVLGWALITKIA
jgi:hypothetical protein